MTTPIKISPTSKMLVLDPIRMGGMMSARRHTFGQAEVLSVDPPREASPSVTTEERAAIRDAAQAFLTVAEDTMVEIMESATRAMNIDNDNYNGFPTRAEALGQALKEAKAVDSRVKEFVDRSAVTPYLEENHQAIAAKISQLRKDIDEAAENAPFSSRAPVNESLSEEKLQQRTEALPELARNADIMVVEAEASGVQVLEPGEPVTRGEMDVGIMPLIGIGLIAAAAWALYEFLGKKK